MNEQGAEALLQVSSGNFRALRPVYDEQAPAAWGLALLVTRRRRRAARVLTRLFSEVSTSPERFADGRDLRVSILAATLRLASLETRRKRWPWPRPARRSRAFEGPVDASFAQRIDSATDEQALRLALEAVEGLSPEDLADATRKASARPSPPAPRWRHPPRSLKALLLMKATEAARPERKYVRWFLIWLAPLAGLVLARLSERTAPRLPIERYSPAPIRGIDDRPTEEEKSSLKRFVLQPEGK
ncbi:MAG: hypothetical protein FD180_268 [Planctomycetota bacterium]|nr:MAG: hypothetical protein FD180_268 [Planctomycetota bacterium]